MCQPDRLSGTTPFSKHRDPKPPMNLWNNPQYESLRLMLQSIVRPSSKSRCACQSKEATNPCCQLSPATKFLNHIIDAAGHEKDKQNVSLTDEKRDFIPKKVALQVIKLYKVKLKSVHSGSPASSYSKVWIVFGYLPMPFQISQLISQSHASMISYKSNQLSKNLTNFLLRTS